MTLALLLAIGCAPTAETAETVPTFAAEIAPILYRECTPCHRPGGEGPFAIDNFDSARRVAGQMKAVVGSGYMPPWMPSPSDYALDGERSLTDAERSLILRWIEAETPSGDLVSAPEAPQFSSGWRLGEPDFVLEMAQSYTLAADGVDGDDEYRNFVLPMPPNFSGWIGAIEFDPGNRRAVHHARILADSSEDSRRRERASAAAGFRGMSAGVAAPPDGRILGWAPGKVAKRHDDLAWRLTAGSDIVLQLHLVPTGREEKIRSRIAFYLADGAPAKRPLSVVLGSRAIDIPAGERDVVIEDHYRLPVDVDLLALYPHAHYLATTMQLELKLTDDGEAIELFRIDDWDFNWQDDYWFSEPIRLPAGSQLTMRYHYDNSVENVQNPSNPPRPVRYGAESKDEMAEMLLQVVPVRAEDWEQLSRHHHNEAVTEAIRWRSAQLTEDPDNVSTLAALANGYVESGEATKALSIYKKALRLSPGDADLHVNHGWALERSGAPANAAREYGRALKLAPDNLAALSNLARLLGGNAATIEQALLFQRRLLELEPTEATAHRHYAEMLRRAGREAEALEHYRVTLRRLPQAAQLLIPAAWLAATASDITLRSAEESLAWSTAALQLGLNDDPTALATQAAALAANNQFEAAIAAIERAIRLSDATDRGELERQRELYRGGTSYRQPPAAQTTR